METDYKEEPIKEEVENVGYIKLYKNSTAKGTRYNWEIKAFEGKTEAQYKEVIALLESINGQLEASFSEVSQ